MTVKTTKALLACGIVGGPLFIVSSLAQAALREGFDLRRHHLSTLSLGDFGWIQVATFILTGAVMIAFAMGLSGLIRWCFMVYGIAMIIGGVFSDSPAFGFPPGMAEQPGVHGTVHAIGAVGAFLAQVVACLAHGWRSMRQGRRIWALYSYASGVVAAVLVFTMDPTRPGSAPRLVATCLVTGAWMTAFAVDAFRSAPRA